MSSTLARNNIGIEEELDFRKEVIYFIIVDRFLDGCSDHEEGAKAELFDRSRSHWGKYWGGDLKGIIEKADYLKSLGVTALWISPLFEQVDALRGEYTAMHGYWTKDCKRINPRFIPYGESNSLKESATLKELVDTLHSKGLKVILILFATIVPRILTGTRVWLPMTESPWQISTMTITISTITFQKLQIGTMNFN